jgi:hypothetical protein
MKGLVGFVGGVAIAIGGLWLLQGLGVVHLRPILCVADCEQVRGPSVGWTLAGLAMLGIGAAAVLRVFSRR